MLVISSVRDDLLREAVQAQLAAADQAESWLIRRPRLETPRSSAQQVLKAAEVQTWR